jgi:hypothetical protein
LAPEVGEGRIKLRLHRIYPYEPPVELGEWVSIEGVREKSKEILDGIAEQVLAGSIRHDHFHTAGSSLARYMLNSVGLNVLATLAQQLDRVVVLSAESDVPIPYEWLRPVPKYSDKGPITTLAEGCSVVRFPLHPIEYVVKGRARTLKESSSLCTIGLDQDTQHPWRRKAPEDSGLRKLFEGHDVVHIVAHYDASRDKIEVKNQGSATEISKDTFLAHPFFCPDHSVILSVCKIGALDRKKNIARMLAETFECAVWTPLVSISESNARYLDLALATFLTSAKARSSTLDSFFLAQRTGEPFTNVYIRYGV